MSCTTAISTQPTEDGSVSATKIPKPFFSPDADRSPLWSRTEPLLALSCRYARRQIILQASRGFFQPGTERNAPRARYALYPARALDRRAKYLTNLRQ